MLLVYLPPLVLSFCLFSRPPNRKFEDKVFIPQEHHPETNFVGLLIGPRYVKDCTVVCVCVCVCTVFPPDSIQRCSGLKMSKAYLWLKDLICDLNFTTSKSNSLHQGKYQF